MNIAEEAKLSRLTERQRNADRAFIDLIKREYVDPLVEQLCERVEGFATLPDAFNRFLVLLDENEKTGRKGDSLTLEYEGSWSVVYAGTYLGHIERMPIIDSNGVRFTRELYKPLFYDGQNPSSRVKWSEEDQGFDTVIKSFLNTQRDKYEELPPAFKVALLVRHIKENIIAKQENAVSFVLGCEDLEPLRWTAAYTMNRDMMRNGWIIRLRDVEPPVALGGLIASRLKATASVDKSNEINSSAVKIEDQRTARRSGSERTIEMVDFVAKILDEAAEAERKPPGAEQILALYQNSGMPNGKEYSSGHSMMTSFDQYIKRHPELADKHKGVARRLEKKESRKKKLEGGKHGED